MLTITVCIGSSCHLKGSYDVVSELQKLLKANKLEDKVNVQASFCLGHCTGAVSVKINNGPIMSVNQQNIDIFFAENVLAKIK